MSLAQHKNHRKKHLIVKQLQDLQPVPTSHRGIRPVVDIIFIKKIYFVVYLPFALTPLFTPYFTSSPSVTPKGHRRYGYVIAEGNRRQRVRINTLLSRKKRILSFATERLHFLLHTLRFLYIPFACGSLRKAKLRSFPKEVRVRTGDLSFAFRREPQAKGTTKGDRRTLPSV